MESGEPKASTVDTHEVSGGLSRAAAAKFADKWKNATDEKQESSPFWHSFFMDVLGIKDLQHAGIEFEKRVISSKKGTTNYIDVFWKDTFLAEQKSAGKDLDSAEVQAREYVVSLPPALRPPIVILCDFKRFRIVDILLNKSHEFALENLPDNLARFEAIISHKTQDATAVQVEADQKAAQLMADLYIQLEKYGYEGHEASVFMVRILFCLFADDTRMWKTDLFHNLVKDTNPLGSDLGPRLASMFAILDTPKDQRKGPQDPLLADFPYVNGGIFSERLETVNFNGPMRNALMNACMYDWSSINPTIFGALFQDIKSKDERRANGEHYTTEENIDKTIRPLFLDALHTKLEAAWDNESKLKELQRELGSIQVLDPACGCGNFLITTYKRLRQLELDIIVRLKQLGGTLGQTSLLDVAEDLHVKLEQLHGIEFVEWSSQIANVAIYLTDHQENMKLETVLGIAANRFPLSHAAKIIQGNALQLDWSEVCPISAQTVIVGNPPFLGQHLQDEEQKADTKVVWRGNKKTGVMDYVSNWFLIAGRFVSEFGCKAAFVSTNSITQGEQVQVLWGEFDKLQLGISFAHRTFQWTNDASGKAAVHVVIIGFGQEKSLPKKKSLWSYAEPKATAALEQVDNINPYLIAGPQIVVQSRMKPLSESLPFMVRGNQATDGGNLSKISPEEADEIRKSDPIATKYLRRLVGAEELIHSRDRYCLWLEDASPNELNSSPEIQKRVKAVRELRLASVAQITRTNAANSHLFQQRTQPKSANFIAVPRVSSESRTYVPMEYCEGDVIASDALLVISDADLSVFALVMSLPFNIWNKAVSGRLKSDTRISQEITYFNFPVPPLSKEQKQTLSDCGQGILDARLKYKETSTLADLYGTLSMPLELTRAHQANDKAVQSVFGLKTNATEEQILSKLFELYEEMSRKDAAK
jgi:hypothetical protein